MQDYDLRSFFAPDMDGLTLRLYQYDRLVEDNLPSVAIHLQRQGVQSHMYATQWFMT